MTFYFLGSEISSYTPSDSSTAEAATSGYYNSSFVRTGLDCGRGDATQYGITPDLALPDTFYCHFDHRQETVGSYSSTVAEFLVGTSGKLRLRTTGGSYQLQAYISSAWTNVGSAVSYSLGTLQTIDIYCEGNNAAGTAKIFLSGTERMSATADLSAVTGITKLRHYGINSASGNYISQCIMASEPTIGMRLTTYYPSGTGTSTAFTGDYTAVDEATYSDADFIYSASNGDIELFTGTGPALTGYVVRAVGVYARAKRGAAGPQNLQLALRVSGSNYVSSSKALGVGYDAYGNIWAQNPDTSADWLTSAIATLQFGVKAIT